MKLPGTIKIQQEDDPVRTVDTEKYIAAKLAALKEFGYASLTTADIREQLGHVIAGHTMEEGLTVIGMFMQDDIV